MELRESPRLMVLCLGIVLWNIPQVVARDQQVSCNKTQYVNQEINICCSRCPPGYFREASCTPDTDTLCQPCPTGSYAAKWNFASSCRTCYPCGITLVEKTPCTATQAPVCACPDGYQCNQSDALNGQCEICEPDQMIPQSTETISTESPPDVVKTGGMHIGPYWIIVGVVLFIVTAVVIILCLKTSVLKRFGRMIKNKNCSTSTHQTETPAIILMDVGGQEFPLLNGKPIRKPTQEQGKGLNFPIQETSTDIGESTLLPKRRE